MSQPSGDGIVQQPPASPIAYANPYYIRKTQDWAVGQERMRHMQALYTVGEWCAFVLMWHLDDFEKGLVKRCPTCYTSRNRTAEVYGQGDQNKCRDCFGTTFEGGYRAIIIRPAIFADADDQEIFERRGVVRSRELTVETTPDFRIQNGDYVFRADNARFRLRAPQRVTLRTGFAHPWQQTSSLTYNHPRAAIEDPDAVCYLLPPSKESLRGLLSVSTQAPVDFSGFEVIRAPLIPADED